MNHIHQHSNKLRAGRFVTAALTLLFVVALFVPTMSAQAATAGQVIGNQASATFVDTAGVTHTSFSNLVQTSVSQVYSDTLNQNQTRYATVGTQVVFPHTYTNTGNGPVTVYFTLGTISGNFSSTAIYIDANGDGIPDNTTSISGVANTFTLPAGGVFKFVVVGTLAAGTANGASSAMTVTATPGSGQGSALTNVDTVVATQNAAIAVTKAMSASSGIPGATVGVTLTYTNTGNAASGTVIIGDPLGSAFTYVGGSGKLNGATLTDGSGGWIVASPANTPTLTLASIAPGVTGTITFNVTVAGAVGTTVTNTANFNYLDLVSGGTQIGTSPTSILTNTVPFLVQQSANVWWTNGNGTFTPAGGSASTTNALGAASVTQGGTISFTDTLTNKGTGTDIFNISAGTGTFPAGTTFQYYRADGVTPLTDTNGDGIIDVGPVAAGGTATIIVKATLPSLTNVTSTLYNVNVIATSTVSTASGYPAIATDNNTVTVTTTAYAVDVTYADEANGTTPAPVGKGAGVTSNITQTVAPGQQTVFGFFVQNTSTMAGTADAYNLSVAGFGSLTTITTPVTTNELALPQGWTVLIHSTTPGTSTCPSAYNPLSAAVQSTPALTAANGGTANASWNLYCVEIDVPASYTAGTTDFVVTANSNATGVIDQMTFGVTVSTLNLVTISPNQNGQIYAGGTIAYTHTITNSGNSQQTVTFPSATAIVLNPAPAGWSGQLFQSQDATGALDNASTPIVPGTTNIVLNAGQSAMVFFKVQAAQNANPGDNVSASITINYNGTYTSSVQDVTTVVNSQLQLVKSQAVVTHTGTGPYTCSTTIPTTWYTTSQTAGSHDCIFYKIVATNTSSSANISNPSVSDSAPPFTLPYTGVVPVFTNTCTLTNPTIASFSGAGATFTGAYTTTAMTPGCAITVTFEVQLN